MDQKPSHSGLKTTLDKVDANRRQFLGLMLAGAAALPALTSTLLAAEPNPSTDKNSTTIKNQNKSDKTANVQLKSANKTSSTQLKTADKTSTTQFKSANKTTNTQLKNADKTSTTQFKSAHKTSNTQLKNSTAIKHSGPQ